MAKETPKAVIATGAQNEVAVSPLEANNEFAEFAGQGFENQGNQDYKIPILSILQAISPLVQERGGDGFVSGHVFNSVTLDHFDGKEGILFIPATTQHLFIEFKPRASGGGFVGSHPESSEIVKLAKETSKAYGKYSHGENELIETFCVYGVQLLPDGEIATAMIPFKGSMIKTYRAWQTRAKMIQIQLPDGRRIPAPLFSHIYRLRTVLEKSPKGAFHNWQIEFMGANALESRIFPSDPRFQEAFNVSTLINKGELKTDFEGTRGGGDDEGGEGAPAEGERPVF
jgi:hypothetical protein